MQNEGVRFADKIEIFNIHFRRKYHNFAFCTVHLASGCQAISALQYQTNQPRSAFVNDPGQAATEFGANILRGAYQLGG